MQKIAFTMQLKPGYAEEYRRRHNEIWPELSQLLQESGIYDYSIFLDIETGLLFGVQKLEDRDTADAISQQDIMKKWWAYMADIMETNPDKSPVAKPLAMVFHMD